MCDTIQGQISFFDGDIPFKIDKPIRLIELFAGIGAQAAALERLQVPFEHYRICEFDKYAVKSYNAVHGTSFYPSDITKIHADDLCIVDTDKYCYIMTYSFPCQDLSLAGKQKGMEKGSGTRSGLLWEVERLLNECDELPQVLLLENVPQVCGKKNADDFAAWCAFLEGLGYKNSIFVLNANQYGTPQERHRLFMISAKTHIRKPPHQAKANIENYLNIREGEQFYGIWDGYNHRVRRNNTVGTITRNVGADIKGNGQGVITYRNHELHIRSLYPIEAWRLMGFTDEQFNRAKEAGISDTQLYKQAGNSIVVDVLYRIFKELL